jgi:hypothetical protein
MAQRIPFPISRADQLSITALSHDMIEGSQGRNARFAQICEYKLMYAATDAQITTFAKLYKLGWYIGKVVTHKTNEKVAFAVYAPGCSAWVTPDGVLERAPVGRKVAYLDHNWAEEM